MADSTTQRVAPAEGQTAQVLATSAAWVNAELKRDFAAVSRLLAEDYVSVTSTGALLTKGEWLALLPSIQFEELILDDVRIRLFENIAILSGVLTTKCEREGKSFAGRYRSVDVFWLRGGCWQAVSSQLTPLES